jgi:hypothetical protein
MKRERILINPFRNPISPMDQDRYFQAYGILYLEPRPTYESVLGADEGIEQITRLYEFLVPFIIPLGHIKPGSDSPFPSCTKLPPPLLFAIVVSPFLMIALRVSPETKKAQPIANDRLGLVDGLWRLKRPPASWP